MSLVISRSPLRALLPILLLLHFFYPLFCTFGSSQAGLKLRAICQSLPRGTGIIGISHFANFRVFFFLKKKLTLNKMCLFSTENNLNSSTACDLFVTYCLHVVYDCIVTLAWQTSLRAAFLSLIIFLSNTF